MVAVFDLLHIMLKYGALFLFLYIALFIALVPFAFVIRKRKHRVGLFTRSTFLIPPLSIILIGVLPVKPFYLNLLSISFVGWLILFLFCLYLSLRAMRFAGSNNSPGVLSWVRSWPGWSLSDSHEPDKESSLTNILSLPVLAILLSVVDLISKFGGFFATTFTIPVIQLVIVAGSLGLTIQSLTSTVEESHSAFGIKTVLRYSRQARFTLVAVSIVALLFWATAASNEARSDLRIVTAQIPEPHERRAFLTLVNRGKSVRILKEFHVESSTFMNFLCKSADFDIPLVGEYELPFHIGSPLTIVKAVPEKQFRPQMPGRVELVLKPDSRGKCRDTWEASIRILVVSEDGRRSGTKWFKLRSS